MYTIDDAVMSSQYGQDVKSSYLSEHLVRMEFSEFVKFYQAHSLKINLVESLLEMYNLLVDGYTPPTEYGKFVSLNGKR